MNNVSFFCHFLSSQQDQPATVTTIASIRSDDKMFVNGKEVNNDQPVKVSRIELIENKLTSNATQPFEMKTPTKLLEQKLTEPLQPQVQQVAQATLSATPTKSTQKDKDKTKETNDEDDEDDESSIVTADYIQQSMFGFYFVGIVLRKLIIFNSFNL